METLYSKLYAKYTKLKVRKETEIEKVSRDQEVKFVNYASAADEFIEHLKNEKEELHKQVNELRIELASISSSKDEQYAGYQKLLFEEKQKSKALTEEIERLQKFQPLETHKNTTKDIVTVEADTSNGSTMQRTRKRSRFDKTGGINSSSSASAQEGSDQVEEERTRKHSRLDKAGRVNYTSSPSAQVKEKEHGLTERTTPSQTALEMNLAECIWKRTDTSSDDCIFRMLAGYIAGIEFGVVDQTDRSISAAHLSTGYSFKLTWIYDTIDKKFELLYQSSSLGTFERIAPDWMREDIVLSSRMCPIFFERLSRVFKLCT